MYEIPLSFVTSWNPTRIVNDHIRMEEPPFSNLTKSKKSEIGYLNRFSTVRIFHVNMAASEGGGVLTWDRASKFDNGRHEYVFLRMKRL